MESFIIQALVTYFGGSLDKTLAAYSSSLITLPIFSSLFSTNEFFWVARMPTVRRTERSEHWCHQGQAVNQVAYMCAAFLRRTKSLCISSCHPYCSGCSSSEESARWDRTRFRHPAFSVKKTQSGVSFHQVSCPKRSQITKLTRNDPLERLSIFLFSD